jgi:hypothetical protein
MVAVNRDRPPAPYRPTAILIPDGTPGGHWLWAEGHGPDAARLRRCRWAVLALDLVVAGLCLYLACR